MSDPSDTSVHNPLGDGSIQQVGNDNVLDSLARRNRVLIDDTEQWVYAATGQPMGNRPSEHGSAG